MHGLILKSFEDFLRSTYGDAIWLSIASEMDIGADGFQPLFKYGTDHADHVVQLAADMLNKQSDMLLEDFGTHLVMDRRSERVRRLLRFGGVDYPDFLHSLEDLRGRSELAVPDLNLPRIEVDAGAAGSFRIVCLNVFEGTGHVLLGVLRALADDYGALAYLEFQGRNGDDELLTVQLLDMSHGQARDFQLAGHQ